ncbi:ankyrin repeat-containing domain protein [Xylariaceae sp. FL1272]|nr:ankyrin repeat-containing domain protein [Xylariaceae sp. FL1272]
MATDEWEQFKPIIVNLYLIEGLPLLEVARRMREDSGFSKSKSQYEHKLKQWHIRKNSSKEVWQYVCYQMNLRLGRATRVLFHGLPLPERKLRKEMSRYAPLPSLCDSGQTVRRPATPEDLMISIRTPSAVSLASPWPDNLPWFHFKRTVLPSLEFPAKILETYFALRGGSGGSQHQSTEIAQFDTMSWLTPNPQKLQQAVAHFTRGIPKDAVEIEKQSASLIAVDVPTWMATELLKVVFFRLSNNMDPFMSQRERDIHDEALICLVKAVSLINPKVISTLFIDRSATTIAIKEHVYGSAIRQRDYGMVSRLLASGLDPDQVMKGSPQLYPRLQIRRGCLRFSRTCHRLFENYTGLHYAALKCDLQLGKILLGADANPDHWYESYAPPLSMIALALDNPGECEDAVGFARLLLDYGATIDPQVRKCHRCKGVTPFTSLTYAIAIGNSQLIGFLIEQGGETDLTPDIPESLCSCYTSLLPNKTFAPDPGCFPFKDARLAPLYFAILTSNAVLTARIYELAHKQLFQSITYLAYEILTFCCLAGDSFTALKLLDTGIDVNKAYRGMPPLLTTAWNADTMIANRLLDLGAKLCPSSSAPSRMPLPLHVAAIHGNSKLVRRFMDRGVDCNASCEGTTTMDIWDYHENIRWCLLPYRDSEPKLSTPLQFALRGKDVDTVKLLLPYSTLVGGELAQAITLGDHHMIDEVIKRGATIDIHDLKYVLKAPIDTSNVKWIERYLCLGGSYDPQLLATTCEIANKSRDYTLFAKLVANRPKKAMDEYEIEALVFALHRNDLHLIDILLGDPFLPGPLACRKVSESPLYAAIVTGNTDTIDTLTQQGYSLDTFDICPRKPGTGSSRAAEAMLPKVWSLLRKSHTSSHQRQILLLFAIRYQFIEGVRESIALVKVLDFHLPRQHDSEAFEHSPLSLAAEIGNEAILRLLLESGADIDWPKSCGFTALVVAVAFGHSKIAEFLLEHNAQVNPPSILWHEITALQYAAINGDLNTARALITRGADVNALPSRSYGRTALEGAAEHGRLDMVHLLLANGAQVKGEMRIYYIRAIKFAEAEGHHALAEYLVQYGGWSGDDDALSNHPHTFHSDIFFVYNEVRNHWHAKRIRRLDGGAWEEVSAVDISTSLPDEDESTDEYTDEDADESEPAKRLDNCNSSLSIGHRETGTTTQPAVINDSHALTNFVDFDIVDDGVVDYGLMSWEVPPENNLNFQSDAMSDISSPKEASNTLRNNSQSRTCASITATRVEDLGDELLDFSPLAYSAGPELDGLSCDDRTAPLVTTRTECGTSSTIETQASGMDTIMEDVSDELVVEQLSEELVAQSTGPDDASTSQQHPFTGTPETNATLAQSEGEQLTQMNWEDPYWGADTPNVYDI